MIRNKQDFWSGILFLLFGVFFTFFARDYNMGSAAKMGPGYFPFYLGLIMCVIGAYVALNALRKSADKNEVEAFDFKTVGTVLLAVIAFGLLLQPMGLFVALFALVMISAFASHEFNLKGALINATVLITLCTVVFVYALKLQFPLYPKFLGL